MTEMSNKTERLQATNLCDRCEQRPRNPGLTLCQECHDQVVEIDPSEPMRRGMVKEINYDPNSREGLEAKYGQVWSTDQLTEDFDVVGFLAPFVEVYRKSDGQQGTLMFQHRPRFYWGFEPRKEHL